MKKWFAIFFLAASPLSAHPGAHVNPHGDDLFWIIAVTVLALAVLAVLGLRRK
ncbi:hypothetical protein SAMN04488523_10456 [Sulfitobacter brevis]|uniref:MYXO-CTERM domain-containing protein n=1 Tax=Sulfitobacter brevis TaxID=74348 RepID=A0A1I1WMN4_9RHOB|nr:peptidase M23 [Sulfitobacter brevis]SFD96437.1 hypothetical protein SAMN04488523_10456 [Sulfitobacter brevis]